MDLFEYLSIQRFGGLLGTDCHRAKSHGRPRIYSNGACSKAPFFRTIAAILSDQKILWHKPSKTLLNLFDFKTGMELDKEL